MNQAEDRISAHQSSIFRTPLHPIAGGLATSNPAWATFRFQSAAFAGVEAKAYHGL